MIFSRTAYEQHKLFKGTILQSTDRRSAPFLDVLIECEQKQVIANSAVQTYTTVSVAAHEYSHRNGLFS